MELTDVGDNDNNDEALTILSDVVHDLKGPVIAAKGFLDFVGYFGELNEQQKNYLGKSVSALDRMERMITMILDYARLGTSDDLRLEPLDLYETIQQEWSLVEGLAGQRNINFELIGEPGVVVVSADQHYVSQIIHNLLINAINYNRDDGKIIVRSSIESGLAQVDIADTGLGIKSEQIELIFNRFYRGYTKSNDGKPIQRGTGLGLAIARAFVELHRGDIWVESTPDVSAVLLRLRCL